MQTETQTQAAVQQAIQRCTQAYDNHRSKLPENATLNQDWENHREACREFLAQLPVLYDPESFQIYLACLSKAVSLGAIDPIDIGRYCHMVQTAVSVWRLTHPAAKAEKQPAEKQTPLPSTGNQLEDDLRAAALARLPDKATQDVLMSILRERGIRVPRDSELRRSPFLALYYCKWARSLEEMTSPEGPSGRRYDSQPSPPEAELELAAAG